MVTPANLFRCNADRALAGDSFTLDTVRPTLDAVVPLLSQTFPAALVLNFSEAVLLGAGYGTSGWIQVSDGTNTINVASGSISGPASCVNSCACSSPR